MPRQPEVVCDLTPILAGSFTGPEFKLADLMQRPCNRIMFARSQLAKNPAGLPAAQALEPLMAQASPFGLILIVGLLLGRTAIRSVMESQAASWHVDAAVTTDAFMLLAVGLVVAQRLEVFIRARAILAGGADSHVEAAA